MLTKLVVLMGSVMSSDLIQLQQAESLHRLARATKYQRLSTCKGGEIRYLVFSRLGVHYLASFLDLHSIDLGFTAAVLASEVNNSTCTSTHLGNHRLRRDKSFSS